MAASTGGFGSIVFNIPVARSIDSWPEWLLAYSSMEELVLACVSIDARKIACYRQLRVDFSNSLG